MVDDWTWGEAGEQALYGIISVFVILIMLFVLTKLSGNLVRRIENSREKDKAEKGHNGNTGG